MALLTLSEFSDPLVIWLHCMILICIKMVSFHRTLPLSIPKKFLCPTNTWYMTVPSSPHLLWSALILCVSLPLSPHIAMFHDCPVQSFNPPYPTVWHTRGDHTRPAYVLLSTPPSPPWIPIRNFLSIKWNSIRNYSSSLPFCSHCLWMSSNESFTDLTEVHCCELHDMDKYEKFFLFI